MSTFSTRQLWESSTWYYRRRSSLIITSMSRMSCLYSEKCEIVWSCLKGKVSNEYRSLKYRRTTDFISISLRWIWFFAWHFATQYKLVINHGGDHMYLTVSIKLINTFIQISDFMHSSINNYWSTNQIYITQIRNAEWTAQVQSRQ